MRLRLPHGRFPRLSAAMGAPRVATLLALVLLIPVATLAAVTGSAALSSWQVRQAAVTVRGNVAAPSALMAARAEVVNEGVPSVAMANAAESHVNLQMLARLSGVDFPANVREARPRVDANKALRNYPGLVADLESLKKLRPAIDSGRASYSIVLTFFTGFCRDIDALWQRQLRDLRDDVTSSSRGTGVLAERISVLPTAYALLTTGVGRAVGTNNLLSGARSAESVTALLQANGAYAADLTALSGRLGPKATAAWQKLQRDPAAARFEAVVKQTADAAVAGRRSPLAKNVAAHAHAFSEGSHWFDDLQGVVQGASADVRDIARHEELAATGAFQFGVAIFLLSVLFALGAAILLIRSVVRPLRRLAKAARHVAEGDFTTPAVKPSGPKEVAETIGAVDEMTAVLAAVESFTVTLAQDPTSAALDVPLPGRTGLALQTTLDRLRESVRDAERQRAVLHEVATHDGLTGLLNRTAALDAVNRELSRARRDDVHVMVLFIDLDGLKNINDTHGHKAGDEAIRIAAHALRDAARTADVVARLGGDEFVVAGTCLEGRGEVTALAERLHRSVSGRFLELGMFSVPVRCSIGIALSVPGDDVESLIHKADEALYAAKRQGRDQISWHRSGAVPLPRMPV